MRKVVSNSAAVAHLWANEIQEEARTGNGNVFFEGNIIYSYGHHYEIARIVRNKSGRRAYIINDSGYSSTTAKHIWDVKRAIPSGELEFYTHGYSEWGGWRGYSHPETDKAKAIVVWIKELYNLCNEFNKARSRERFGWGRPAGQLGQWREFWGINKKDWVKYVRDAVKAMDIPAKNRKPFCDAIIAISFDANLGLGSLYDSLYGEGAYGAKEAKIRASRERATAAAEQRRIEANKRMIARERMQRDKDMEDLAKWHNHEKDSWYPCGSFELENHWHTALRMNADKTIVETSKHIRIGLEEARRLWTVFEAYHAGHEFHFDLVRDEHGSRYRCQSYENDVFTIGCHKIPYSEARGIAEQLGWA